MATIYLRSTDGDDADDGSTWALAKATLAAALAAAGAGGTIYVYGDHAETQATSLILTSPGTAAAPVIIVCVGDLAEPPTTLAMTATVSVTGASNIAFAGFAYSYGVTFQAGSGTTSSVAGFNFNSAAPWWWKIEAGRLSILGTAAASRIMVGAVSSSTDDQLLRLVNSSLLFSAAGQGVLINSCSLIWEHKSDDVAVAGATLPTTLFYHAAVIGPTEIVCRNLDLSNLGTGKNLVSVNSAPGDYSFVNCKTGAGLSTITGTIAGQGGCRVSLDNCDSGDTNYRMERYTYEGSVKTETSKVRSGGASDGTTPLSWNMTTLAGASFVSPLESPAIARWNETTGSAVTVTVEIAQDSAAAALNDDEVWLEIEYLGTSGVPLGSVSSDRKLGILAAAATQTASTETWTGLTSPTRQKLSVTFTPQEKGYLQARVMLGKPSVTVYVDPLLVVS